MSFVRNVFSQRSILNVNIRTRTEEKLFQCEICQKSWSQQTTLNTFGLILKRSHFIVTIIRKVFLWRRALHSRTCIASKRTHFIVSFVIKCLHIDHRESLCSGSGAVNVSIQQYFGIATVCHSCNVTKVFQLFGSVGLWIFKYNLYKDSCPLIVWIPFIIFKKLFIESGGQNIRKTSYQVALRFGSAKVQKIILLLPRGGTQLWVEFNHHPITEPEMMQICDLCLKHLFLEGPYFKPISTFYLVNWRA